MNPHAYTLSLNFIGIRPPNSFTWFLRNSLALTNLLLSHTIPLLIFPAFTFRSDQLHDALIYRSNTVFIRGVRYGFIHTISAPPPSSLISAVGFIILATNGYITLANVKLSTKITYENAVTYIWCPLLVIYLITLYSNSRLLTHMYIALPILLILAIKHILLHLFHTLPFMNTIIPITPLNIIHAIVKGTPDGLAGIRFVRRRILTFPLSSLLFLFSSFLPFSSSL